jgi:hypothetical protein
MRKLRRAALTALTAVALSCAPAMSSASFVATTPISGTNESPALAALDLLNVAVAQPNPPSVTSFAFSANGSRAFATSAVNLRSDTDAFLWSLLNITRAQRDSQHFDLVVNTASFVLSQTVVPPPSAVPLPGTVWLFLTGLLGLAGTRLSGPVGGAGPFRQRKGASPVDAPLMA